jgi:predicted Zn-dependent protease
VTHQYQNNLNEAMQCFNAGCEIDPSNPLNLYQKSQVLLALGRDQEALDILLNLK